MSEMILTKLKYLFGACVLAISKRTPLLLFTKNITLLAKNYVICLFFFTMPHLTPELPIGIIRKINILFFSVLYGYSKIKRKKNKKTIGELCIVSVYQ